MERMDGIFTSETRLLLSIGSSEIWLTLTIKKNKKGKPAIDLFTVLKQDIKFEREKNSYWNNSGEAKQQ